MADRYQDRPYPAEDNYGRGGDQHDDRGAESDPLAELARLIGQTDQFAMGRANVKAQPRAEQRPQVQQYQPPAEPGAPVEPLCCAKCSPRAAIPGKTAVSARAPISARAAIRTAAIRRSTS